MFGQTGFRLLNAPTFLPAYMILLSGGSDFVVGLALGLQALGAAISPFLGASLVEHRKKALPVAMWVGTATRLQILIIALAGLLLPPEWALAVILVTLTVYGAFQGMQGVIFQFVMSKVIPVSRRGRLTGLRNFTAGLTAAGVAYLGGFSSADFEGAEGRSISLPRWEGKKMPASDYFVEHEIGRAHV